MPAEWLGDGTDAAVRAADETLAWQRTDVRRALALLAQGRWLRLTRSGGGEPVRAAVQLSRHPGDRIPVGVDVLGLLQAAAFVARGRTLPGGDWRFDLTPIGRAAAGDGGADGAR